MQGCDAEPMVEGIARPTFAAAPCSTLQKRIQDNISVWDCRRHVGVVVACCIPRRKCGVRGNDRAPPASLSLIQIRVMSVFANSCAV